MRNKTDSRPTIQRNLANIMAEQSLTQSDVAKRAGCSQKTISNILSATAQQRTISLDALDRVAAALGIPTYALLVPGYNPATTPPAEMDRVLTSFTHADQPGRDAILGVSDIAARYEK